MPESLRVLNQSLAMRQLVPPSTWTDHHNDEDDDYMVLWVVHQYAITFISFSLRHPPPLFPPDSVATPMFVVFDLGTWQLPMN